MFLQGAIISFEREKCPFGERMISFERARIPFGVRIISFAGAKCRFRERIIAGFSNNDRNDSDNAIN